MALKEKVSFRLLIDPDDPGTLILMPVEKKPPNPIIGTVKPTDDYQQAKLQNGSVYTVNIKDLEFTDGSIFSDKVEFYTKPDDYMFVEVDDIQSHIRALNIPDENILDHIIDASKQAVYWAKKNAEDFKTLPDFNSPTFQEDYYPFYMYIEWLELIVTITADPKWALRGKYSYAIYNSYCNPYHKISWYKNDYSRGF